MNFLGKFVWSAVLAVGGLVAAMVLQITGHNSDASLAALLGIGFAVLSLRDR